MKQTAQPWSTLLMKFLKGTITTDELEHFNSQKAADPHKQDELDRLLDPAAFEEDMHITAATNLQADWRKLQARLHETKRRRHKERRQPALRLPIFIALMLVILIACTHLLVRWYLNTH